MEPVVTRIAGSCHCQNITFTLHWPEREPAIQVRECSCSFCSQRNGAWTSHTNSRLEAIIADESCTSRYQFGTCTADFMVCSICGFVPFVLSSIDGIEYAVVNVNAFNENQAITFVVSTSDFDGEETNSRLTRRQKNWIANVKLNVSATR